MKAQSLYTLVFLTFSLSLGAQAIEMPDHIGFSDNLHHPKGDEQALLKAKAMQAKLLGKTQGKTKEVGRDQFVELGFEKSDRIFVIIVEFGDLIDPEFGGTPGPRHNQIAQPNRTADNATIWQKDFNRAHYEKRYFKEMTDYYANQSSGRYTFNGDVTEWVRVPYNAARYGSNSCGSRVCPNVWLLIRDAINTWVADRLASGWSKTQIHDYLATFDKWDRYDADGDGVFNEPDGYIDHFQIVHAGEGEETGGGAQGEDAIWSHRWFAANQGKDLWGPPGAEFGGMEFGGAGPYGNEGGDNAVGIWVGDYTIQPENGGLGVFAHEYAHDLGLPDQYDTANGDNSTGFWTIMSSGSYLGDGSTNGIGTRPSGFTAWEKFNLGWLNYEVAFPGAKSDHELASADAVYRRTNGLFVLLPDKEIVTEIARPFSGSRAYYSGSGNNLDNSMSRSVTLPAGPVSLNAQVNYNIELDWDYAYLTVNGQAVPTNLSTGTNPNNQNQGEGITGSSNGNWVALSADLSAYAGQTVQIGFRYWTDGGVAESGILIDDIAITGTPLDDAESNPGWTFDNFKLSNGTETSHFFNAYIAEYRAYRAFDQVLQTGPYNFGFRDARPDWVEHYPYQDGMLVSYWDSTFSDNNTIEHPGGGLILPIDAHPAALMRPDSIPWRSGIQSFDSTFSLSPTDAVTLHRNSVETEIPSLPGVSVFDDTNQYWNPLTPLAGVKNPQTGTSIRIKGINNDGYLQVQVIPGR